MAEYEQFVNALKHKQAGKLSLVPGETERGVMLRVRRAAKRLDKAVDVWSADGFVYFKLI
jgi:hypothetical protein